MIYVETSPSLETRFQALQKQMIVLQAELSDSMDSEGETLDRNNHLLYLLGNSKLLLRRALRIADGYAFAADDNWLEEAHAMIARIGPVPQDPRPEHDPIELAAAQAESRQWRRENLAELRAFAVDAGQPVDDIDRELTELNAKDAEAAMVG